MCYRDTSKLSYDVWHVLRADFYRKPKYRPASLENDGRGLTASVKITIIALAKFELGYSTVDAISHRRVKRIVTIVFHVT